MRMRPWKSGLHFGQSLEDLEKVFEFSDGAKAEALTGVLRHHIVDGISCSNIHFREVRIVTCIGSWGHSLTLT